MSIVAVKIEQDKIIIGADSIRVSGWTQEKDKYAKLQKVNGMIIGSAGLCKEASLLIKYAESRRPRSATEQDLLTYISEFRVFYGQVIGNFGITLENAYILVFDKKAFYIRDFYIREINDYYAIGAGMDFALAALYLGKSVKESIEAACELSIFCEKPVNLYTVKL